MDQLRALLVSLRPKQWIKNLVVFVGLVFGQRLFDADSVQRAVLAFLSFCLAASSIYLFNDVADREEDRRHPTKRLRPIAAGRLSPRAGIAGAALAAAGAFGIAIHLSLKDSKGAIDLWESSRAFVFYLIAYVGLNVAYSMGLKHVVIADVLAVSIGFLIRVVAGTAVLDLAQGVSSWLILCAFYLATFLALAKRRGELKATAGGNDTRPVLVHYDLPLLDTLITIAATAAVLSYSIYTAAPETIAKFHTRNLIFTVPLAVYGIGRYLFLVYRRSLGEDPTAIVFKDRALQLVIALWVVSSILILYHGAR